MLLGTVISGGDTKRECLKWWTNAWSEARSLDLNREQDTDPELLSEGHVGIISGARADPLESPKFLLERKQRKRADEYGGCFISLTAISRYHTIRH